MRSNTNAPAAARQAGATSSPEDELVANCTALARSLVALLMQAQTNQGPGGSTEEDIKAYAPKEVARILSLKEETVRDMCRTGTLRAIKCGQQWRIPRMWLLEFIEGGGCDAA